MKDDWLASKLEGKTNFLKRLKQFDGLTWLTLTPLFYNRQIYTPLISRIIYSILSRTSAKRSRRETNISSEANVELTKFYKFDVDPVGYWGTGSPEKHVRGD